jgi:hypothetical protein
MARQQILKTYFDMMRNGHVPSKYPPITLNSPGDLDQNYDVVFKTTSKTGTESISQQTIKYGLGTYASLLRRDVLENAESKSDNDGFISICIGLAFRFRTHEYLEPFVPDKKAGEKANKEVAKLKKLGYDSIVNDHQSESRKVYWHAGSVLSVAVASIKVQHKCKVCFDCYANEAGYACSKKHFICWDCLGRYVKSAAEPGAMEKSTDAEGNPKCTVCSEVISHQALVK